MTNKGKEIFGTFLFNGITFDASYRYEGPKTRQGGYDKCLVVYSGNKSGKNYYGHSYFGDDKFSVDEASISDSYVTLKLSYGLHKHDYHYSPENLVENIILKIKK